MGFNRREFIKTGGLAMLGSIAMPSMFSSCESTGISGASTESIRFALNHFGITESNLRKVLSAALEKGGDYADLFFEHTYNNSISLQDGAVNRASSNIDFGMGVRVLSGDQTGYAYVEDVTLNEMLKAARTAARIASAGRQKEPVNLTEITVRNNFYRIQTPWDEIIVKDKMPYLQKMNEKVFALDSRVTKVNAGLNDSSSHIFFCNSEGQMYYDFRPMAILSTQCIMTEGNRIENNGSARAFRMGGEFLSESLVDEIAKEAIEKTSILFQSVMPKGGEMPVVMGTGGSGILLHEAIGHAFEADFNRKNTSIFSDKLNKKICDSAINVVDDATVPFSRGSINIDDEGIEGQKTYIVREGVLSSYLHDRISAKHYGIPSTGNGRRQSFRYAPIPRMRVTYMESGKYSEEEIIASVKNGIYAATFTNGQVQIGAGDFTFFTKNGFLIENGKLTRPIKDVNIIGNGPQALADITMVGNNLKIDTAAWTCGKDGQGCAASQGMPSALVSKLTVGGES